MVPGQEYAALALQVLEFQARATTATSAQLTTLEAEAAELLEQEHKQHLLKMETVALGLLLLLQAPPLPEQAAAEAEAAIQADNHHPPVAQQPEAAELVAQTTRSEAMQQQTPEAVVAVGALELAVATAAQEL